MQNARSPTPEEMVNRLIQATRGNRWNHFEKDFAKHSYDWLHTKETPRGLNNKEYRELPIILATHRHVELCTYIYKGKRVWGYYRGNLRIDRFNLSRVGVIYDPIEDEIIHCMRFEKGKRYCDQRQHQDFVKIRW